MSRHTLTRMAVAEMEQVRAEAEAWFRSSWDPDLPLRAWWKRLAESGWGFPTWPSEWYGRDLPSHLVPAVQELLLGQALGLREPRDVAETG